ncbi:MAG: peptidase [Stutzerimonas stutzeri]|nr:MAG: peptidase [Stutzerimonas stutzeri]
MSAFIALGLPEALLLAVFTALMVAAGIQDALTMKISNKISILLIAGFVLLAAVTSMSPVEIGVRAASMLAIFAILLVLHHHNLMGGGDVKLMSAGSLWFQAPEALVLYIGLTSIFGGVVTLVLQFMRTMPMPLFVYRLDAFGRWQKNSRYVPYGIGIALGAITTQYLLLTPIMR